MNRSSPDDLLLSDFDFALPQELIATEPIEPRDAARLLHVKSGELADRLVRDLPELLRHDDLLVMNDTRVIPARLFGLRGAMKVEVLLHKRGGNPQEWFAFARPGKRLRIGDVIRFADDFGATVLDKREGGEILIRFDSRDSELLGNLQRYGHVPLPPYIKRPHGNTAEDRRHYQTIYADRAGAVAAPTAGLHFTHDLMARLDVGGIKRVMVTLHVGGGTFLPVKTERVLDHVMHSEWCEVTPEAAEIINAARREGRRIVAVGTTALRVLESATGDDGIVAPFSGDTSIFITPGYRFMAVDVLMTNFHLPKSTLFMLCAAFAGLDNIRAAYAHAIDENYRFYSYGDATLLER